MRRCKHGHSVTNARSGAYLSWGAMIQRCYNPKCGSYLRYGARGVTVCDRWRNSFQAFLDDLGDRPPGGSLDRINAQGNYEPGNVRWATLNEQSRNRKTNRLLTIDGRTQCLADWADEKGIKRDTVYNRLRHGWPIEEALAPLIPREGRSNLPRPTVSPNATSLSQEAARHSEEARA